MFVDYLNKKFLEYQMNRGVPTTMKEFSEYLGIPVPTYSSWVNGGVVPSTDYIKKLSSKLGAEVYDILGKPRPEPTIRSSGFPPEVIEALEEARLKIIESGVVGNSERSLEIIREALNKVGVTSISKMK